MKTEQLQKANELKKFIDDYESRINVLTTLEEVEESSITNLQFIITVKNGHTKNYANQEYGSNNQIPLHLKEKITEELEDCARRIKRIFDKEIKKLEKEFESL